MKSMKVLNEVFTAWTRQMILKYMDIGLKTTLSLNFTWYLATISSLNGDMKVIKYLMNAFGTLINNESILEKQ